MADFLTNDQIAKALEENFASWIRVLKLQPVEANATQAKFILPENADISREGDIICGQAISAAADTVGVLSLWAAAGSVRAVTTVDMTTHFLRPLFRGDVEISVNILSNGRRLASARTDFRKPGVPKICATATCAFAYLDA